MAQTQAGLFPVADPDRHAKGRQKMHGLALYINHVWEAAASTDTTLCRDHGMEADSERIALEIAPALAAIRTLDLEVIRNSQQPADGRRYLDLQKTDPQGQVVHGLLLARNADIHLPATLDLHVDRVVGGRAGYRVVPSWQPYDKLPNAVRSSVRTPTRKVGTSQSAHDAYRDVIGGQLVIETLLDAFAFFLRCDPSLAQRVPGSSELAYFPLPAYAGHDYERSHPDQPNRAVVGADVRRIAVQTPPTGRGREISYRLTDGGTAFYCGYTVQSSVLRSAFTEAAPEIARDILAGYQYVVVAADGTRHVVSIGADGHLIADGAALDGCSFNEPTGEPSAETWRGWWQLTSGDPFYHRTQRQGH
ncbi:hypothetical protein ACIA49_38625 [Kribbella sp. NPDC051587]|uniref:hypothetical protein n=1 Tax=Kribbella sp. NPDC051587 TaxID=3364119 RepID=UPI00378C0F84